MSVHGEKKVLNLLHRFKTNHKLRTIAAKMPENVDELDDLALSLLPSVIEAGRILNTKPHLIVSRLKRIKRGNKANGKRLARMNKLAALLDKNGNLPTDTATQAEFDQYVQLTVKNDSVVALQHLRNTKPKKREMVDEPGVKTSEPSKDLLREWGF